MQIYYYILITFVIFVLIDKFISNIRSRQLFILSCIFLGLFAGSRSMFVDNDYYVYSLLYEKTISLIEIFNSPLSIFFNSIEPSFLIIAGISKSLSNNGLPLLIFIYAIIGVYLKAKAILKISDFPLLSLLLYFSSIFLLQDMTQIRAGIAIGFILLSLSYLVEENFKVFFLFLLAAVFFHYSAIIFVFLYFINTKKIDKFLYISLIFLAIFWGVLKLSPINLLSQLHLGVFTDKINAYAIQQRIHAGRINIFNFSILIQTTITLFFVYFSEKIDNKYAITLTKINCLSVVAFYLFASTSPAIAFRLSELLSSVQIILIPCICYIVKPKGFSEIIIILISLAYFINQIIINQIFKPYKLTDFLIFQYI